MKTQFYIEVKTVKIIGIAQEPAPDSLKLPLYLSRVQAGWPSPADDYIDSEINLQELIVKNPPATYFLRAAGESMLGVGIHDGDLLVVDRSENAANKKIVIASIDGELLVKQLVRRANKVFLVPANPDYPEIEITDREYVHIWGVVTYVIHKP